MIILSFSNITYAALPSSYSSVSKGYVTTPKDQGKFGTCVSFSTISAIETSLIKKGQANKSIDLSEYQLAYLVHNWPNKYYAASVNKSFLYKGVNIGNMQTLLFNNIKITTEQKLNYSLANSNILPSMNQLDSGNVTVENTYYFTSTKDNIKNAIVNYLRPKRS